MWEPKPEADGLRRYNKWAGNPHGHKEDVTLCIVDVTPNERAGFAHSHQCNRKRGHGPGGLYCKQHDPESVKARRAASNKAYEDKWHAKMRPYRQRDAYKKALEEIAAGHNDPRSLAAEALLTD